MTTSPSLIRLDSLADRYRIAREVGHGGMASVFLAHAIGAAYVQNWRALLSK